MFRRHRELRELLDRYEVIGQPVVRGGLSYVPWVQQAVRPYRATRLPTGSRTGLDPIPDELRATITSRFRAA